MTGGIGIDGYADKLWLRILKQHSVTDAMSEKNVEGNERSEW